MDGVTTLAVWTTRLAAAALPVGLVLLPFKTTRPLSKQVLLLAIIGIIAGPYLGLYNEGREDGAARQAGWTTAKDQSEANKAGFSDPKLWHARIEGSHEQAAREAGWSSSRDREQAGKAGFSDPKAWANTEVY